MGKPIKKRVCQYLLTYNCNFLSFCSPSRGALLTGRFAGRLGLLQNMNGNYALPMAEVTLAQELKSAGYRTSLVGKWDLG